MMGGVDAEFDAHTSFPAVTHRHKRNWTSYAKTAALVFSWICLGLYAELPGPTLPTLMYQTGSNYTQAGLALSIRSGGLLVGSLFGGWMADYFIRWRVVQLIVSLLLASLTNLPIPWTWSFPALAAVLWVAGFSHGLLTTSGNPLLASIWDSQAAGPFCIMHAGYGLGAAMTSVFVSSFSSPINSTVNSSDRTASVISVLRDSNDSVIIDPLFPYIITAVLLIICAFCFIPFAGFHGTMLTCISKQSARESWDSTYNIPMDPNKHRTSRPNCHSCRNICTLLKDRMLLTVQSISGKVFLLFVCVFIMYFAIVGNERVFGKFVFTYAIYGPVRMTSSNGYLLNLLYWTFFGLARVLTCLLALILPSNLTLSIVVLGTLFASIGLTIIPPTEAWFFAFTCLFSLFKSPLFPVTLAVVNRSHQITGAIVFVVNFGSACGAGLLQYAAGALIDRYGQRAFPYLVCGSASVVLVTAAILLLTVRSIGDRFAKDFRERVPDQNDSNALTELQSFAEEKAWFEKEGNSA